MTIRPVVYDPEDSTGGPDVALILRLLAETPNPPNEDPDNIGSYIADPRQIILIDDVQDTVCRMSPRPVERDVPTPWWLWDGVGSFQARLFPLMRATLLEILKRHPASGTWPAYGEFPGVGDTPAEKLASAEQRARTLQVVLGGVAAGTTVLVSPNNPILWRTESTVAKLLVVVSAVAP